MLVLTRKAEESIIIGESIVVTLLGIRGNTARIGIAAPADVAIRREEVEPLAPDGNLKNDIDDGAVNA